MLFKIINIYLDRLKSTKYFQEVHGLAEIITETRTDNPTLVKSFPAVYKGSDSLKFVSTYDFSNGFCYFISKEKSIEQDETKRANVMLLTEDITLTFYGVAKHTDVEGFVTSIQRALEIKNEKALRKLTGAVGILAFPSNVNTDKDELLDEMFENIDIKKRHDIMVVKCDITLNVSYYNKCITNDCC
jgi:hypothetical protein